MENLRGWWKPSSHPHELYSFPRLSDLTMKDCRNLTNFPQCPKLDILVLGDFNQALSPLFSMCEVRKVIGASCSSSNRTPITSSLQKQQKDEPGRLRTLTIDDIGYLRYLTHVEVMFNNHMESLALGRVGQVFRSNHLSSLLFLKIFYCRKLKSLAGREVWAHLTALESLALSCLNELELNDHHDNLIVSGCTGEKKDIHDDVMPWKCLGRTLISLELYELPKLVRLPKEMVHLTALQSLSITFCNTLEELPEWIGCLSSLKALRISFCRSLRSLPEGIQQLTSLRQLALKYCSGELKERCCKPSGDDWPKIQHIPQFDIH